MRLISKLFLAALLILFSCNYLKALTLQSDGAQIYSNETRESSSSGLLTTQSTSDTSSGTGSGNNSAGYSTGMNEGSVNRTDVNLESGSVVFSETDLGLPGKNGLNLAITRTYNSSMFQSNSNPNTPFGKAWGPGAGSGWSFNISGRAYLVYTSATVTTNVVKKIIVDGSQGGGSFTFKTSKYEADVSGNYSLAETVNSTDAIDNTSLAPAKILIKAPGGITAEYGKKYYTETHIKDQNENTPLVKVTGYLLTIVYNLYDNAISYSYDDESKPDQETPLFTESEIRKLKIKEALQLTNAAGVAYGDLANYFTNSDNSITNYQVKIWCPGAKVSSITDTYGRIIGIEYFSSGTIKNYNYHVQKLTYTGANNSNQEITYEYNNDGTLKVVKKTGFPDITYNYTSKTTGLRHVYAGNMLAYAKGTWSVNGNFYAAYYSTFLAPGVSLPQTTVLYKDWDEMNGQLLTSKKTRAGAIISYDYEFKYQLEDAGAIRINEDTSCESGPGDARSTLEGWNNSLAEDLNIASENYTFTTSCYDYWWGPIGNEQEGSNYFGSWSWELYGDLGTAKKFVPQSVLWRVTSKKVYATVTDTNGVPGELDTAKYSFAFTYPETKSEYELKNNSGKGYYYATITVDNPQEIADETYNYEAGLLKSHSTGTLFLKKYAYDEERRLTSLESCVNDNVKQKAEYSEFDVYGNPKYTKLYKGNGTVPEITTERTYYSDATHINNRLYSLVKTEKVSKAQKDYNEKYFEYNAKGQITKVYKGSSSSGTLISQIEYHPSGLLKHKKSGDLTNYGGYVEYSDLTDEVTEYSIKKTWNDSTSYSETSYYDKNTGALTKITDANGNDTMISYYDDGRTKTRSFPQGSTTYTYASDLSYSTINDNGREVTSYKDVFGRTTKTDNPNAEDDLVYTYYFGNKLAKVYKNSTAGLVLSDSDYDSYLRVKTSKSLFGETAYSYDEDNNKVTITEKSVTGNVLRSTEKYTNDLGQETETLFNATGTTDKQYETRYNNYNVFGEPEELTDANGNYHRHSVTAYGQLDEVYHSTTGTTKTKWLKHTYDAETGLLDSVQYHDDNGLTGGQDLFAYEYDKFQRLYQVKVNDIAKETYYYSESGRDNGNGRLTSVENSDSKTVYDYDNMGRVKTQTVTVKSLSSKTYALVTNYENHGGIDSITLPNDGTRIIDYGYDADNKLETISYDDKTLVTYHYNDNGTIDYLVYGNGYTVDYEYQKENQLTAIIVKVDTTEKYRQSYTYDLFNNINSTTLPNLYKSNTATTRNYTYNIADELTRTEVVTAGNTKVYNYDYDKNGNAKTFSIPSNSGIITTTTPAIKINAKDQIQERSYSDGRKIVFGYDTKGNLTSKTRSNNGVSKPMVEYVYNYQDQLTQVKEGGTVIAEYGYDSNRYRIYRKISKPGFEKESYFVFDLGGRELAELDKNDNYLVKYIYSGNEKIAMIRNGQTFYFVNNAQGTPILIMDANGRIKHRQELDEYGNLEQGVVGSINEINYTGKRLEPATNLYYFLGRWYDPELGRFLTHDPKSQYLNPYSYVSNSPLMGIDADGCIEINLNFDIGIVRFSLNKDGIGGSFMGFGGDYSWKDGGVNLSYKLNFFGIVNIGAEYNSRNGQVYTVGDIGGSTKVMGDLSYNFGLGYSSETNQINPYHSLGYYAGDFTKPLMDTFFPQPEQQGENNLLAMAAWVRYHDDEMSIETPEHKLYDNPDDLINYIDEDLLPNTLSRTVDGATRMIPDTSKVMKAPITKPKYIQSINKMLQKIDKIRAPFNRAKKALKLLRGRIG